MSRRFRIAAIVLIALVAGAYGYGVARNPERATLDAVARAGAPGKFVGSSHGTTHYDVAGPDTGRVVVLVHGFSVPYYIWDSTFVALSRSGMRVVRYDVFGRGWSDRPDAVYDGALYDAQLDELLDSLHIPGPIDLVGLSYGGFITAHYVGSHPSRVRTLTLVDPASSPSSLPTMLKLPLIGPWLWQTRVVPGMAAGQASDFLHAEHFPAWADLYRPQMHFRGFGRALLRTTVTSSHTDYNALYAAAGKTGVPTLLIWGKEDHTVPIALSDVVRRGIPQAEFFPVDSAAHLPHIEQATIVHEKMRSFFAAHPVLDR
jgi:pimeloyl-ACP methyl ester carboxylesterase